MTLTLVPKRRISSDVSAVTRTSALADEASRKLSGILSSGYAGSLSSALSLTSISQPIDWPNIRTMTPPFVPVLKATTDTSHFPTEELADVPEEPVDDRVDGTPPFAAGGRHLTLFSADEEWSQRGDIAFVGYTYKRFDYLTRKGTL